MRAARLFSLAALLQLLAGAWASAWAESFDLAGFGKLPVLHEGRVKPIESVARGTLLMLRGRQSLRFEGRRLQAREWFLDLLARPEKADLQPVFLVESPEVLGLLGRESAQGKHLSYADLEGTLGLLGEQAEAAASVEPARRSRFQKAVLELWERLSVYQRIKRTLRAEGVADMVSDVSAYTLELEPGMKALAAQQAGRPFDRRVLASLTSRFQGYRMLSEAALLRPLAPARGEPPDAWESVGDGLLGALRGRGIHPGVMPYLRLARAWETQDAEAFNAGARDLLAAQSARLPRETGRAGFEARVAALQPFYFGMVLYVVALLLVFAYWLAGYESARRFGFASALLAFVLHTAGIGARMVIEGRPPVTNLYSSAVFVGWLAVLVGLFLERRDRKGLGLAASCAVGFASLLIAHHLSSSGDTMEVMRAVLDSNFWLATHVVTITMGYGANFLAGTLAHFYLFSSRSPSSRARREALPRMVYGVLCFALFFTFLGTVLGGIWADQSWGRFWGWDPKENGALVLVLWNALILHARWGGLIRERGLMVMAVFGNILTALSWFGVNMLGIGLHSYGFMDKAFWWLLGFALSQAAVMAALARAGARPAGSP